MITNIDEFFSAQKLRTETREFPEHNFSATFREMSAKARINYRNIVSAMEDAPDQNERSMAAMVLLTIVDESGNPVYTPEREESLLNGSYEFLAALFDAAMSINGLDDKALKDAKKKLSETTNSDSPSDSAPPSA